MKEVDCGWHCGYCDTTNPTKIPKPTSVSPVVVTRECEICDTKALLRFRKVPGQPTATYVAIRVWPSLKGEQLLNDRKQAQKAKQKETQNGNSNVNVE